MPPSPHKSSNAPPTPTASKFPKAPSNSPIHTVTSTANGGWVFFWICFVVFGLTGLYAFYRWYSGNPIELTRLFRSTATRLVSSHQVQPINAQSFESATSFQRNNT
jgi:hypothetical protein